MAVWVGGPVHNKDQAIHRLAGGTGSKARFRAGRWRRLGIPTVAFFSFLAGPVGAEAPPAPLDVTALAQIPFISDPILSPDGKRILARINYNGTEVLAIYELADGAKAQPTVVPIATQALTRFGWAGNDKVLIGYRTITFALGYLLPATRLRSYDSRTKAMVELGNNRGMLGDDVIFIDPDGKYVLLSAQNDATVTPSVDRVDLATGASVEVQRKRNDIWNWFADASGTVRGGISYTERAWTIYYKAAGATEMRRAGTGRFSADDSVVDTIRLLPGSDSGLILTNGPTGRFAVYRYQLGTAGLGAPIFEHPDADVTALQISADGTRVNGVAYEDDRPRIKWLVPELEQLQATIDRTLRGKDNMILSISRDDNIVLLWSGGSDDPGSYYVFDRAARRMNLFATPFDALDGARFSSVAAVRYAARDGLSIPAYLTLPRGREPKGLPLIVMPHGGPFDRDSNVFNPWVQLLADRGYAVLQPNFRGSTGYGRTFVERGYGEWGQKMQDDLDDGVAWLAASGTIDPKRICLMGASYGGYAALWGAIRNPDLYRCAISMAAVTDVRAILKYDIKLFIASRYSKQWKRKIVGEESRNLAAVSPLQQAARLNIPVLIAHGERDATVPVEQGRKLVAALRNRGASVQSAFYPRAGHGFEETEDSVDFLRRVEAFLDVHNPADPNAPRTQREARLISGNVLSSDLPESERKKKEPRKVGLRYTVTADGRVTACAVRTPSVSKVFDTLACRLAQERFQYLPARDANGNNVEASVEREIAWTPAPAS